MMRLRVLCLATVPLFPATVASAQHTISLLGGMNLTILANQAMDDRFPVAFQRATGANLGLAASYMLSPQDTRQTLSLQLAGTYSEKGAALGDPGIDFRMDYLELALLADAKFPSIVDGIFVRFLLGPALAWLQSCQRNFPADDNRPAMSKECEAGEFRDRDFAVVLGSGLEFRLVDRLWLTTSFLYTIGLGYINYVDEFVEGSLKNRALTLRAGISVPFG